jgi:UDP-N-acetylglucosamine 2-epimerase (non-hydrolysing)
LKKIISVVGARPNFMKIAPIHRAFQKYKKVINHLICHTGQHYDEKLSKIFFDDLELPEPDFYLGVGSGSHAEQTGTTMIEFEKVLLKENPDLIIVVGDVNSTIACSLTAVKLHIPTVHVEAGLRSFDRKMPEEINRILTDTIADYLFVTEQSGLVNLKNEGISEEKVYFVGNVMIDSLIHFLPKATTSKILDQLQIEPKNYVLATLHRPSNVDEKDNLSSLVNLLNNISLKRKVIFPIHPRTKNKLDLFGILSSLNPDVILTDPIGYLDFIKLIKNCGLILTDSGGIQEESTYLGIQCITIRTTTERPVTVEMGTNHLAGDDYVKAEQIVIEVLNGKIKQGKIPEKWDGKTSERITEIISLKLL